MRKHPRINFTIIASVLLAIMLFAFYVEMNQIHALHSIGSLFVEGAEVFGHQYGSPDGDMLLKYDRDRLVYLGETDNGYQVSGFPDDEEHNFLYFYTDGGDFFTKGGYTPPSSGEITAIIGESDYNTVEVNDEELIRSVVALAAGSGAERIFTGEELHNCAVPIYAAYGGCHIATRWIGNIAFFENKWFLLRYEGTSDGSDTSKQSSDDFSSENRHYPLPGKYIQVEIKDKNLANSLKDAFKKVI